jgi:Flp pilus assembly pilin Flp
LTGKAKRRASREKDSSACQRVSPQFESIPHQQHQRLSSFIARPRALELPKGGESILSISDLVQYLRVRLAVEEGQTMAEYGIVLAVITVGVIGVLGVLSGAIQGALTAVSNRL